MWGRRRKTPTQTAPSAASERRAAILAEVADERVRQVLEHGYTASHDDQHSINTLVAVAGSHAAAERTSLVIRREHLVKAAAVLVAAIESIDRRIEKSVRERA